MEPAIGMDHDWDPNRWVPTVSQGDAKASKNDFYQISTLIQQVTKRFYKMPYDVEMWLTRARALVSLGYLELAAGDAYKAVLLLRDPTEIPSGKTTIKGINSGSGLSTEIQLTIYQFLIDILRGLKDLKGVIEVCEEVMKVFPSAFGKYLPTIVIRDGS